MERRVIVVTGQTRPHELLLFAYGAFVGVTTLLGSGPSVMARFPDWITTLWAVGFVVSAICGFVGTFWRKKIVRSLWLQIGAMLIGASVTLIYALAVLYVAVSWSAIIGLSLMLAWTAANLWRAGQIRLDLKKIAKADP